VIGGVSGVLEYGAAYAISSVYRGEHGSLLETMSISDMIAP
jgi:hypothetical protein